MIKKLNVLLENIDVITLDDDNLGKKYVAQFEVNNIEELIEDMIEFTGVKDKESVEIINKKVSDCYISSEKEYVFSVEMRKMYTLSDAIKNEELLNKEYYHYTTKEGLDSIMITNKIDSDGMGNYVCDNMEDLKKFMFLALQTHKINLDDARAIVFTTNTTLEVSTDHNKELLQADAYVSYEPIEIEHIKDIIQWK
ncbi:hypothetical protein HYH38_08395 [Clostridium botulinum]|uniref:hypothetical protein n=1 Tax=Clostridium botulinum TaxID=1491 RepID=UPI001966F41B|nr:hypothetical protein [Clostridium botulinum]MBN1058569.1 hypothetical protein [Clostridium botulinum]MBY6816446.1 hypothetical protein [Clostridium botulinum]MBY6827299.1 hypothetical protein [Clostridium botulinum]MBY6859247.1 hypothetical protein [Clostridium botulinum]MBY7041469.1 hypothetical protein [Clostridium botulinum]